MKKRTLSLILTVVILLGAFSFSAFSATVFEGGDGSEQSPYLISTPGQLDAVRNDLDAHYKLINDIVFDSKSFEYTQPFYGGFKAIGTFTDCFTGSFDGNGFAIKNIRFYKTAVDDSVLVGVFGCVLGTVKNLTVSDSTVEIKTEQIQWADSMLAGVIAASNGGTILNCTNNASIKVEDNDSFFDLYLGGIVGRSNGTVKDCKNTAKIISDTEQRGSTFVGGIAGDSATMANCDNSGELTVSVGYNGGGAAITASVGGIAGAFTKAATGCTNSGDVNCYLASSRATGYIGGITGSARPISGVCNIDGSTNTGHVNVQYNTMKMTGLCMYAGGIAGHLYNTNVTSCDSHGGVTVDEGYETTVIHTYLGGIAGYTENAKIEGCNSTFGVWTRATGNTYIGGIAGYSQSTITDCTHTNSSIIAYAPLTVYAGGVAGYGTKDISRCLNNSKITVHTRKNTASTYSGGIVGYAQSGNISECYNAGDFSAEDTASTVHIGGIAGHTPTNSVNVSNCFNAGNALSSNGYLCYVGGITGENGTITNVYTAGEITASSTGGSSSLSAYYISGSASKRNITGAYFLGAQSNNFGVGCSEEQMKAQSTFVGFDFNSVWTFDTSCNYLYPQLRKRPVVDEVTAIEVTPPAKRVYYKGSAEAFDLTGGTVNATYKFAGDKVIPLTEDMVSGFTTEKIQNVMITVKIGKLYDYFTISVECDHDYQVVKSHNGHYFECSKCDDTTSYFDHEYEYDCSTNCSVCNFERSAHHYPERFKDDKKHWYVCETCNETLSSGEHVYRSDCDTLCSECWYVREGGCIFDNDCDKECNRCGATRLTSHKYVANCSTKCSVCGSKNPYPWEHTVQNTCTTQTCESCFEKVAPTEEHAYLFECSETCWRCKTPRKVSHSYNEYSYNNDATTEADGTRTRYCKVCSASETAVAPDTRILTDTSECFDDIPKKSWYKKHVDYAVTYNIFSGTSATAFSPSTNMSRAQFVQVFANLTGVDTSNRNVDSGFTDVPRKKWYTAAVKWAADNGIVSGMGNGTFQPNADVTREQMCVMLVGYVEKFQKSELAKKCDAPDFADHASISKWARKSVYKCADAELVSGVGGNRFDPQASATRAQGATIFSSFYRQYIKKY